MLFQAIGIQAPVAMALWVGLISQFLPVVGTYIAGALPVLVQFVDSPPKALVILVFVILYQQVENYFLLPRITARTMDLHPAVAFGSAIAGGAILGAVGAILAIPAAAMAQAVISNFGERHEVIDSHLTTRFASETHDAQIAQGFGRIGHHRCRPLRRSRPSPSHNAADATSPCTSAPWSVCRRTARSRSPSVIHRRRSIPDRRTSRCRRRRWFAPGCSSRPNCWRLSARATTARPRTSMLRGGSLRPPASTNGLSPTLRICPSTRSPPEDVLRAGGGPTSLQMNCSGKHSGMLATSSINGWPVDASYLSPDHPVQQHITATIDELVGEPHSHIGVDGCGSPAHVISLLGLARGFRSIATGAAGPSGDDVYLAMTTHPEMVGGTGRDVTHFMHGIPGLMAKDGADGVFAAALPDGRAVAIKIADGANRARPAVMVAALQALDVDTSAVESIVTQWILGHGEHVGEVRAIAP